MGLIKDGTDDPSRFGFGKDYSTFENEDARRELLKIGIHGKSAELTKDQFRDLQRAMITEGSATATMQNIQEYGLTLSDFYKVNSQGLRSDEFTIKHDSKLHVLFAGCSNTFGDGMLLEESYAYKTYKRLSEQAALSGFFNIGIPGGDPFEIFNQISKYIFSFGIPDILFINFPDKPRNPTFLKKSTAPDGTVRSWETDIETTVYAYYQAIVEIIISNGGEVYSFSYDPGGNYDLAHGDYRGEFSNYFMFSEDEAMKHIYKYTQINSGGIYEKFYLDAFDDNHPGIAFHDFWYTFIYDKFAKNTRKGEFSL